MGLEFELKYRATEQVQQEILKQYGHLQWQIFQMQTTYFDTPSGALSKRKFTLRCRLENGVPVCTVKTPAGECRGEWELQGCGDIHAAIPKLCAMGAPAELEALCSEGLVDICGARFTRHAAPVHADGAVLELAVDNGCLFSGNKELALCEVEVELKSGTGQQACAWAAAFSNIYGLQPEEKSKFRRALELREEEHG